MTPAELKALRLKLKISLIELAAQTGLPSGYLEQLAEGEVIPLDHDLKRIEKALERFRNTSETA